MEECYVDSFSPGYNPVFDNSFRYCIERECEGSIITGDTLRKIILYLLIITILGGFLRLYKLGENPVSLSVDEVSIGYNAYSILQTGKDEYGYFMPLTFKSLGDYKPPLYIYLVTPSVAAFGLNEFAVRFPSAFLGMLSIPLIYLFFLTLTKRKDYALLGATLMAISPWSIYFSRDGSEAHVAMVLLLAGVTFLIKSLEGKKSSVFLSVIFLVLSMYTYHAERIFVPLFLLFFFIWKKRELLIKKTNLGIFLSVGFLLLLPLGYGLIFGADRTRVSMTLITSDVAYLRTVAVPTLYSNLSSIPLALARIFDSNLLLLFFYSARKFLAYFQPSFLFYSGLLMTTPGNYGLGIIYLFELPFLILGIYKLFKSKGIERDMFLSWVLLGVLPAALTLNEQHPIRTLLILPMTILVLSIGGVEFLSLIRQLPRIKRRAIYALFSLIVVWNLLQAFLIFAVHFPKERGEALMEGSRESAQYAINHQGQYREIVYDPVRGLEGPYITNAPYAYILFYSKYDPLTYQMETQHQQKGIQKFGKYIIRSINWSKDQHSKGVLFIGSPWSIPYKDLKPSEVLDKIYLSNGQLALVIVSPQ